MSCLFVWESSEVYSLMKWFIWRIKIIAFHKWNFYINRRLCFLDIRKDCVSTNNNSVDYIQSGVVILTDLYFVFSSFKNLSIRICISVFPLVVLESIVHLIDTFDLFSRPFKLLPWMRYVNRVTLRERIKLITRITKMSNPLDFVLSIIHKTLIEAREILRQFYNYIRFLNFIL